MSVIDQYANTTKAQYKSVADIRFQGTRSGELDKSEIDAEENNLDDHYLFGSGEDKEDYSYPVVDADGYLRRSNVESAHSLGARGVPEDELNSKLRKLNDEFDSPPISPEAFEDSGPNPILANADIDASDGEVFERGVTYDAADASEQIAIGAVMVPGRVDFDGDYFRADTIREMAANFEERVERDDAVPGVMHATFPAHVELADSKVVDEPIQLGERDLPEGTWITAWKFNDDQLWSLVEDGILSGYSIGGVLSNVERYDPEDHPEDVEFPEEVEATLDDAGLSPDEVAIREATDGRVFEVSAVDMPAVPDASHEAYKSAEKANPALTGSIVEARSYLEGRGHDPDDARRLANYLNRVKSNDPDGWIERAKQFFTGDPSPAEAKARDDGASTPEPATKSPTTTETTDATHETEKQGRTLSAANLRSAMAVHDAALDMIDRSDIQHGRERFSDDDARDFDLGVYASTPGENGQRQSEQSQTVSQSDELAASSTGGDDTIDTLIQSMNTDDLETYFSSIEDNIDSTNDRLDTIEAQLDDTDDAGDNGEGDDAETREAAGDLDERVSDLEAKVEEQDEKVDTLLEQNTDLADNMSEMAESQSRMQENISQMVNAQGLSQQADVGGEKSNGQADADGAQKSSLDDVAELFE